MKKQGLNKKMIIVPEIPGQQCGICGLTTKLPRTAVYNGLCAFILLYFRALLYILIDYGIQHGIYKYLFIFKF